MARPNRSPSPFAVFGRRDFRLLFAARFSASAGGGLTAVAAAILIFQLTESAWSVGLLLMATALPNLAIGLLAGVFVDRFDQRRIMLAAQLLRVALVGAIPLLLPLGVTWVYGLVLLSSAVDCFFTPAQASVLLDAAPDHELAAANALMTISECAALTIGYAGAGLLAGAGLVSWAFWLNALAHLAAAGCIALLRASPAPPGGETSVAAVAHNLRQGLGAVRDTPVLRSLFLAYIPAFALFGIEDALLLPFATRALGASAFEYSLLESVSTLGFVVGGLAMVLYTDRLHAGQWVVGSFLLMGAAGAAFALLPSVGPALALYALIGLANTPSYVGSTLIMQRNTPRAARGRVTSAFGVVRDACFLLGMGAAGLGDVLDVRWLLLGSWLAMLACGLAALRMPGLGQPSIEWRRALRMLRTAPQSPALGLGRAATLADVGRLAGLLPALARLSKRQRHELALAARVHAVPAGTPVVRQHEPSDAAYFLLEGRTVALLGEPGGEILETHAAGDFFGEIAALTGVPRTATVVAEQATTLLQVPAAALRSLLDDEQVLAVLMGKLNERVLRLELRGAGRLGGLAPLAPRELWTAAPTAHEPLATTEAPST